MVRIHVVYQDNSLKQITLTGHANYRNYGNDIVCAAVSATYLCTINAILSIDEATIQVETKEETQIINILKEDEITNKLLHNMIRCLESLEKQYPNNIKIK